MPLREIVAGDDRALQDIADALVKSHKQILVTGAGISTSCGIPDFRSKDGLYNVIPDQAILPPTPPPSDPATPSSRKRKAYTTDDEEPPSSSQSSIFSSSSYRSSPSSRMKGEDLFNARVFHSAETTTTFYQFIATLRRKINEEVKQTSPTHKFIRTLRDGGRLMRCYTQNIDGLEAREGLCMDLAAGRGNKRRFMKKNYEAPRPHETRGTDFDAGCEVVQLHGELGNLRCRVCATEQDWTSGDTDIFLEGAAPNCEKCAEKSMIRLATGKRGLAVGELRPNIVLYGEDHPQNALLIPLIAFDQASNPDLLIIMGTSLKVHGLQKVVRDFAKVVHAQKNGRVIFVNRTRPSESQWDGVIDDYIAMDCDAWIADLQKRRKDLWLRQGELDLSISKSNPQKRKRKPAVVDDDVAEPARPKKKSSISVNVPPLRPTQSKTKATPSTKRAQTATTWISKSTTSDMDPKIASPCARQRPEFSPLSRHFRPLRNVDHDENHFLPGSPISPAYSALTAQTPRSRIRYDRTKAASLATPTPKQNMSSLRSRESTRSTQEIYSDDAEFTTPTSHISIVPTSFMEDANTPCDGDPDQENTQSPVKQLSFVDGSVDGEEPRPLFARSKNMLMSIFNFSKTR